MPYALDSGPAAKVEVKVEDREFLESGPPSSDSEHNGTVRATLWLWLEPFFQVQVFHFILFVSSSLGSGGQTCGGG